MTNVKILLILISATFVVAAAYPVHQDNFARILEDDTDSIYMKQGDGSKECLPPSCLVGRPARSMKV